MGAKVGGVRQWLWPLWSPVLAYNHLLSNLSSIRKYKRRWLNALERWLPGSRVADGGVVLLEI